MAAFPERPRLAKFDERLAEEIIAYRHLKELAERAVGHKQPLFRYLQAGDSTLRKDVPIEDARYTPPGFSDGRHLIRISVREADFDLEPVQHRSLVNHGERAPNLDTLLPFYNVQIRIRGNRLLDFYKRRWARKKPRQHEAVSSTRAASET